MSIDEDAYNLDALPLARLPWPATLPSFDGAADDLDVLTPTRSARDVIASGDVAAMRWTCRLTPARTRAVLADASPSVIVSVIDADPLLPLQLYWSLRERDRFGRAIAWLRESFPQVAIAIPDDLPSRLRSSFAPKLSRAIDASYPSGNWRLLPRAMRVVHDALVLDAVALLDCFDVATRGVIPQTRPIAISAGGIDYRVVDRGTAVASLIEGGANSGVCAGPRLRERHVAADARVDDGELTFHLVPHLVAPQSPCVRCGWCVQACPTHCDPVALMRVAQVPNARRARSAGLASCIDCGICTAVCPSRLPLHGLIDALRDRLADRESA